MIWKETAATRLCCSGPKDQYMSFHIRAAGDWTKALYKRCEISLERDGTEMTEPKLFSQGGVSVSPLGTLSPNLKVHVDGPFGAPAQDHSHFDCLLLVVSLYTSLVKTGIPGLAASCNIGLLHPAISKSCYNHTTSEHSASSDLLEHATFVIDLPKMP